MTNNQLHKHLAEQWIMSLVFILFTMFLLKSVDFRVLLIYSVIYAAWLGYLYYGNFKNK